MVSVQFTISPCLNLDDRATKHKTALSANHFPPRIYFDTFVFCVFG